MLTNRKVAPCIFHQTRDTTSGTSVGRAGLEMGEHGPPAAPVP